MVSKLRAGIRQDVQSAEQNTPEETAVAELAGTMLDDPELMGPSLVMLTARSCSVACASVGRQHKLRERDFGPIE